MQVTFRHRLSYRQARNTVLIALFLGIVLSVMQISYDLFNEQKGFESTISQVIGLLKESAGEAVYNVDERLAEKVVSGLFEYQPIRKAKITDDMGTVLSHKLRSPETGHLEWLVKILFGGERDYRVPLYHGSLKKALGRLDITVDTYIVASNFIKRSIVSIVISVILAFALAGILALVFYVTVTNPLVRMSKEVTDVDPKFPDAKLLEIPKGHEITEMGNLVQDINQLLKGFADSLESRWKAEMETRKNQEALFQAAKMVSLGTLVSGVAHEINNPNTFILSNIYNMQKVWDGVSKTLDQHYEENGDFPISTLSYSDVRDTVPLLLRGIEDGAERIKQIVAGLRDFARKERSDSQSYEPLKINDVVKTAMSLVAEQIKKSTYNFSIEYGENIPEVKGNFHRLEQVVINLVLNACQALPDPSKALKVQTSFDLASRHVILTVEDEGVGIDKETQSRIFDPFFTTKSDAKGMGLGLAISQRIINDHQGKIDFQSHPDRGTKARVILPVGDSESGINETVMESAEE